MRAILVVLLLVAAGLVALWQLDVVKVEVSWDGSDRPTAAAEAPPSDLVAAIRAGDAGQVQASLAAGADANATGANGQTPLMIAAAEVTDPEVLVQLIKGGAQVNAQDANGRTALMIAAQANDNPQTALTLLQAGADPTLQDAEGNAALNYAAENGPMRRSSVHFRLEELTDRPFNPAWPSGYRTPVAGATFSSRASHLPNSPRAYRNGIHQGFDFYDGVVSVPIQWGTPGLAVADGVVVRADHDFTDMTLEEYQSVINEAKQLAITPEDILDKLRGRQVWLEHPGGFVSRYVHLSGIPEGLTVGDRVTAGEVVGYTGNSGTEDGAAGNRLYPHMHYELWKGNETYLGEGLNPEEIYPLVAQVFGQGALPPYTE